MNSFEIEPSHLSSKNVKSISKWRCNLMLSWLQLSARVNKAAFRGSCHSWLQLFQRCLIIMEFRRGKWNICHDLFVWYLVSLFKFNLWAQIRSLVFDSRHPVSFALRLQLNQLEKRQQCQIFCDLWIGMGIQFIYWLKYYKQCRFRDLQTMSVQFKHSLSGEH